MRLRPLRPAICLVAVLAAAPASAIATPAPDGPSVVPDEVIVRYDDGSTRSARGDVQRSTGTGRSVKLPGGSRKVEILDGDSVGETVAELEADPRVRYAVPNYVARATEFLPNDPGFGQLGDWRRVQWNFFDEFGVNAPAAWELASAAGAPGGKGVVVAVLDTGVAYRNRGRYRRAPDLNPNRFVRGFDFVDDDPYADDANGHGTHVTGTIAQRTNNRTGVTGLAYGVKIMPVRVLDSEGAGDSAAIARAIRFAAARGAKVINLSLEFDTSQVTRASQIPDIVSAVRYAHRRGVVVVAAAGNEATNAVAFPARTEHVIAVGATTENGCQADYSNTGSGLDVAAPGGGSDAPNDDNPSDAVNCRPGEVGRDIFQQTYQNSFRRFGLPPGYQGTSMSSPHVAATAALIIATQRLGRRPTPAQVQQRIEDTARDLGPEGRDSRYGAGLMDTAAALAR